MLVVLLDVALPDGDGLDLLGRLRGAGNESAVLMMSGHATIDAAVRATKLGALLQRVIGASVQNIDDVILELQDFRERLDNESARMQRAIVEYATMSQAAMQSTRIIAESLTTWKRPPDDETPGISA